ncbi:MAG: DsbA family protein, partial [Alphaproteobacteria bacterium]|nr:DsbA family protein [Alphaproteobacteria bacterium]
MLKIDRSRRDAPRHAMRAAVAATALACALLAAPAARAEEALTPAQRKAVEQLIESYIKSNPEIVMRALEEAHKREQAAEDKKRSDALAGIVGDLARDGDVPSFGPADADVTVVEFSDYNCGYCKAATPRLFDTVQADG